MTGAPVEQCHLGSLEIVEVQFGAYLGEDDIVRQGDDDGRA